MQIEAKCYRGHGSHQSHTKQLPVEDVRRSIQRVEVQSRETYFDEPIGWSTVSCFTAKRAANQMGILFLTESLPDLYLHVGHQQNRVAKKE